MLSYSGSIRRNLTAERVDTLAGTCWLNVTVSIAVCNLSHSHNFTSWTHYMWTGGGSERLNYLSPGCATLMQSAALSVRLSVCPSVTLCDWYVSKRIGGKVLNTLQLPYCLDNIYLTRSNILCEIPSGSPTYRSDGNSSTNISHQLKTRLSPRSAET